MSSLSIGIVGLPNVGKSTLFNALTNNDILAANYPFATIEPNTGIVPVPDERLAKLAEIYGSQKILPATVTFVDIAGLVAGASKGEGLGNKFLANIRQCNAIIHIVRAFEDDAVLRHDESKVDPKRDIETINTELCLADLQTLDSRRANLEKQAKSDHKIRSQIEIIDEIRQLLGSGTPLISEKRNMEKEIWDELQRDLNLLTMKPVIYAFNVDEATLNDEPKKQTLRNLVTTDDVVFVCAKLEEELKGLEPADAEELLESYGVDETGLMQMIHAAYDILGLQSYLTAGPKEIRAWTIKKGSTAPEAAGVIHTDFEKGFITAQVINYPDLVSAGSEQAAKSAGKVRTEGRDYVMQSDDVVEFRFNV